LFRREIVAGGKAKPEVPKRISIAGIMEQGATNSSGFCRNLHEIYGK
jgi:hypothetical protein